MELSLLICFSGLLGELVSNADLRQANPSFAGLVLGVRDEGRHRPSRERGIRDPLPDAWPRRSRVLY